MNLRTPARLAASGLLSFSVIAGVSAAAAPAASAADAPCVPRVYYTINTNAVNLRTGPSTGYASRGLLYKGDWGRKIGTSGSWIKLRLGQRSRTGLATGTTGWVAGRYAYDCVPTQTD
ncbi:SH3 domain-containing protein [Streptomyces sp. NPDC004393]